jgi:hypothetical protein
MLVSKSTTARLVTAIPGTSFIVAFGISTRLLTFLPFKYNCNIQFNSFLIWTATKETLPPHPWQSLTLHPEIKHSPSPILWSATGLSSLSTRSLAAAGKVGGKSRSCSLIRVNVRYSLSPLKGGRPVIIWYRMQPKAQRSAG